MPKCKRIYPIFAKKILFFRFQYHQFKLVLCQSSIDECHSCESRNPANNGTGFRIKCGMTIPQTMLDRALVMETTAAGGRATPDSQPIFVKYTRLEMVTYSGSSHFLFSKDFYPALLFKTCRPDVTLLTFTGTGQTIASPWACFQPGICDWFAGIFADTIRTFLDSLECIIDLT